MLSFRVPAAIGQRETPHASLSLSYCALWNNPQREIDMNIMKCKYRALGKWKKKTYQSYFLRNFWISNTGYLVTQRRRGLQRVTRGWGTVKPLHACVTCEFTLKWVVRQDERMFPHGSRRNIGQKNKNRKQRKQSKAGENGSQESLMETGAWY